MIQLNIFENASLMRHFFYHVKRCYANNSYIQTNNTNLMRKIFLLLVIISVSIFSDAQSGRRANTAPAVGEDAQLFSKLKYRLIGPFRGGRSAAATGSYKNKNTFYFGATGGGVWKTTDGGSNWTNISDKYFGSSIGAVAVAPSDETIIYVGEGENTMRII